MGSVQSDVQAVQTPPAAGCTSTACHSGFPIEEMSRLLRPFMQTLNPYLS